MFWEKFVQLCIKVGKSPNKVCAEIGYSTAISTKWKNGAVPRDTTLKKIADYFGIAVEYFKEDGPAQKVSESEVSLTPIEKMVIIAYRNNPEMQKAVNMLLGIPTEPSSTNDIADAVSDTGNNSEKWREFLNNANDPRQTDKTSDFYRAARSTSYSSNDLEPTNEEDEDDTFHSI